jgi:hypothetical protein
MDGLPLLPVSRDFEPHRDNRSRLWHLSLSGCRRKFNEHTGTPFNYLEFPTDIVSQVVVCAGLAALRAPNENTIGSSQATYDRSGLGR